MPTTTIEYELKLSTTEIIVHSIELGNRIKTDTKNPPHKLGDDRDEGNSRYKGKFFNVSVDDDCARLSKVSVTAEGPTGSTMTLTATLCGARKLKNPQEFDDLDGSLTDTFQNIETVGE